MLGKTVAVFLIFWLYSCDDVVGELLALPGQTCASPSVCFCASAAASILCLIPPRAGAFSAYCCFQEVNLQVLEICTVHILRVFFLPRSQASFLY